MDRALTEQIKILFLAANTDDSAKLQLQQELKEIRRVLRLSPEGSAVQILAEDDVLATQLHELLLKSEPHIVHFAGHADQAGRLVFHGTSTDVSPVTPAAMETLFGMRSKVKLVVFNTCYSAKVAEKLVTRIPFCIGTSDRIADPLAIQFAASFYQALGYGQTIREAFDYAGVGVTLAAESLPPAYRPTPDQRPTLHQGSDVDPSVVRFRSPLAVRLEEQAAELGREYADKTAKLERQHADRVAQLEHQGEAATTSLKRRHRTRVGVAIGGIVLTALVGGIMIAVLKSEQSELTKEIRELGGDTVPPVEYPPKSISLTPNSSREALEAQTIKEDDAKTAQRKAMNEWWNDILTYPRGPVEELLVVQSDDSFAPPYKSSRYSLKVSTEVRIARAAAFLYRDGGGDTTYRPVYRQMQLDFRPEKDREGTLYLDRPRRGELVRVYLWVSSFRTGKAQINGRSGRTFDISLTDMVPQ